MTGVGTRKVALRIPWEIWVKVEAYAIEKCNGNVSYAIVCALCDAHGMPHPPMPNPAIKFRVGR